MNDNKLNVIYSLSTAPFFAKNKSDNFEMDNFELYTAIISSLTRRKAGNKTTLYCDTRGKEYIKRKKLEPVWNEVLDLIPDNLDGICPTMFWAAGKLFALKQAVAPVLMLDTDFIAWTLPELGDGITAAHRENLSENIYPNISYFDMANEYNFPNDIDESILPLNTAFLYISDESFKQTYVSESLRFMRSSKESDDFLKYMVFAEQRLLAMLADRDKVNTKTLLEFENLNIKQSKYTHIWGAKQVLRAAKSENERFCEKCKNRIRSDFPKWEYIIDLI